ncbi:TetR family transcriptional regulator [Pseudonocardia nematodicida]|uniref:TetR family transcriptional regulator n=1 Tax=Pseudonocardia nematodicida TaxID=1206997 RepID=A0ABV1KCD0_9PSEU
MNATDDPATAAPGLRERKKLATREAVRAATVRLTEQHGIGDVTVEMIARAADVSVRTFFNHFPSKEEAVLDVVRTRAAVLIEEFRRRPPEEPLLDAVREAALTVIDRDDALGRVHLVALRLVRDTPTLRAHEMAVLAEQEAALAGAITVRLGVDPASDTRSVVAAAAALSTLRIALDRWLARPDGDLRGTGAVRSGLAAEIDDAFAALVHMVERP